MLLPQKKIWFAVKVLAVFAVTLFFWQLLTPAYNIALAWASTGLMHLFENPNLTLLKADGYTIHLFTLSGKGLRDTGVATYGPNLHFNIVILVALILSTPISPFRLRLRALAVGLGILFLTHVGYEMASTQLLHANNLEGGNPFQQKIYYQVAAFSQFMGLQLAPLLIWGGILLRSRKKGTMKGGAGWRKEKASPSPR